MYCHKYMPTKLENISYHSNICKQLTNLAKSKICPNMIFNGIYGTGKRTLCYSFLNSLYDSNIYNIRIASIPNEKDVTYFYSNYHIEIDMSLYKSVQKNLLLDFIKEYASTVNIGTDSYKIILFLNAENISQNVYCMLRRIIELTYKTARFIFITRNISSIPLPIRSRLLAFNIPVLKIKDGLRVLKRICNKENIPYSQIECKKIIKRSYNTSKIINLHDMINFFELSYIDNKIFKKIIHEEHSKLDYLIRLIKKRKITLLQFEKIREIIIEKYIECYKMKNIIKYINNKLLDDEEINDKIKHKIVELSSKKELELLQCNKVVIIIENYIISLIDLINSS